MGCGTWTDIIPECILSFVGATRILRVHRLCGRPDIPAVRVQEDGKILFPDLALYSSLVAVQSAVDRKDMAIVTAMRR